MPSSNHRLFYHLTAFVIVAIWGSTFVFTKLLLQSGLSPAHIFTLRFIIAYILLLLFEWNHSRLTKQPFSWLSHHWKDELVMAGLGLTGGSLYFLSENAAMLFTTATNTSLIVCSCPLFTMIALALAYTDEHISNKQLLGSVIACVGMAVVVLNGRFVLHLSPKGDLLAFAACISWAFYSLLIKQASTHYSTLFITRKVFFYGVATMLPYYLLIDDPFPTAVLLQTDVILNLLFLGCIASMLCFVGWNWVLSRLGTVETSNWIYFNPITTIIFASWILHEPITSYFLIGTLLILFGMYLAVSKSKKNDEEPSRT